MGSSVRPDDPVAAYKAKYLQTKPDDTSVPDPVAAYKAKYLSEPEKPGLLTRVATGIGNMLTHPGETAKQMIAAPVESFFNAVVAPGVGEARHDPRLSKGGNSSGAPIGGTYDAEHGGVTEGQRTAAGVQSLANVAFPGIASGVAGKVGGGILGKALGAATAGGAAGAAYTPDDPMAGAATGALLAPLFHGVSKVVGGAASGGGSLLRDAMGRPAETGPAVQIGPVKIGTVQGLTDRARAVVGKRVAMDQAAGSPPNVPAHPSLPPLAVDQGGPNVQGYVEGMANRPGPARAIITQAVEGRQAQMRPKVSQAFDEGTGTTAEGGEQMLQRLATEHQQLDEQAAAQDAAHAQTVAQGRALAKIPPVQPNPLAEWRQMMGGSLSSGIQSLRQFVQDRTTEANQLFGQAKAETAGQAMQSPTLDQIRQTPVGRMAETWARAQKANRLRALPQVEQAADSPTLAAMLEQGVPRDKATAALGDNATVTTHEEALDPETVHYMKQYIAKVAKMGVHDGAQGVLATQANGAVGLWGQIRDEMPPVWRQADDAFSRRSKVIDALNAGRDLMRTQLNPSGMKALHTSMDAVGQRVAAMSPEEQQAFLVGGQSAITDHLRSGGSTPRALAQQLAEPTSAMAQRFALATGDPSFPQQFGQRVAPVQRTPFVPPDKPAPPQLSSGSQAAEAGLGVLKYGVSNPDPTKTLAALDQQTGGMGAADRRQLQQGAAQALRGEFQGSTAKSPGRVFAGSPERVRQTAVAFPAPAAAADFQSAVAAWDAAQAQAEKIGGNSRTGLRGAEGSGALSKPSALFAGAKQIIKSVVDKAGAKLQTANQQALEAEAARLLVSPELQRLPPVARANLIRQGILRAAGQGSLLGALKTSAEPQP